MSWTITNERTDDRGFQLQTTEFESFNIEQLRSPRAASDAAFLPARVVFEGQEVWSFAKEYKSRGFTGMAFLREVGDELVIMISTKKELLEVVPVRDLSHRKRIGNEFVGGRKLKELIELKELIAKAEGLEPIWSRREVSLRSAISKSLTVSRQAAKSEEAAVVEQEKAKRRAERDAKRANIIGRKRIFAHTLSGDRRHGHPVVGDEWMCLSNGAFCISVTSYDAMTGKIGELIESFMVKQDGTKKVRHAVTVVTEQASAIAAAKAAQQSFSFLTVPVKGELEEVILATDMNGVRTLRDQGLNSGTLVMCPKAGDKDRFSVFSITAGKIEPVTEVMRKHE
jgi:hypothetical protein